MRPHTIRGPSMGMLMGGAEPHQLASLDFLGIPYDTRATITPHNTRIHHLQPPGQAKWNHNEHRADVEKKLLSGICDRSDVTTSRVQEHIKDYASHWVNRGFDKVSYRLLRDHGISPAWVMLLASFLPDCEIELNPPNDGSIHPTIAINYRTNKYGEMRLTVGIAIGDKAIWDGQRLYPNGIYQDTGLPQTVKSHMPGRPLKEVVSHPVLDQYNLTVEKVEGTFIKVRELHTATPWNPSGSGK